jgi:type IV secretory pathway VirB10-like protein
MRVKVSEGKTKDVAIIDVTPENYIVPDNEKHLYHCVIEIKKFDSETGKRLSIPRIQKFGKKGYENSIADNLKKQGYTITVLHDPNEYMKAKAEADEKAKAEKAKAAEEKAKAAEEKAKAAEEKAKADAKAKAEADAKARAEEKAALKKEILEELKAAGIIPAAASKEPKADAKAKAEADAKAEGKK